MNPKSVHVECDLSIMRGLVMSESAVELTNLFEGMSDQQAAEEYLSYPPLPMNTTFIINKLAVMNFNCLKRSPRGQITYKTFRQLKPEWFPVAKDTTVDYLDTDQVTPVIITSKDGKKYRVDQQLWYSLANYMVDIMEQQSKLKRRLMPVEVFLDEHEQWLAPLAYLGQTGTTNPPPPTNQSAPTNKPTPPSGSKTQ